jgi:hypothetical protein
MLKETEYDSDVELELSLIKQKKMDDRVLRRAAKQQKKNSKILKQKLPDRILAMPCLDKVGWTESWTPGRNLLNIPHPFRGAFCGPPSSGKSTSIKNIIIRSSPVFDEILVVHFDTENSIEWDDVGGCTIIGEIPDPLSFDRDSKRLLILEDLNLKSLPKEDKEKVNRLFGYTSSHCNLSVVITAQNPIDIPVSARRMSNLFVLYKCPDIQSVSLMASRTGIKAKDLHYLYNTKATGIHDSVWIDISQNSPGYVRINGFDVIDIASVNKKVVLEQAKERAIARAEAKKAVESMSSVKDAIDSD